MGSVSRDAARYYCWNEAEETLFPAQETIGGISMQSGLGALVDAHLGCRLDETLRHFCYTGLHNFCRFSCISTHPIIKNAVFHTEFLKDLSYYLHSGVDL